MRVTVSVTRDDIRAGMKNLKSTCGCPIWHALRRAVPQLSDKLCLPSFREASDRQTVIYLPEVAYGWQKDGTNGEHLYPFKFDVEVSK